MKINKGKSVQDNSEKKLFYILNNDLFTYEFISGIAGDRNLTKNEKNTYSKLLEESGNDLYVKLLFYITHQIFTEHDSKLLWDEILEHKKTISSILDRNVEISVAALDYLTNIKNIIKNPKLIGEAFIGKIAEITSIDPLTKLYNRQYLFLKLKEEFNRYKRYGTTFSVLMIDIDDFKSINDSFGHQKGDAVLSKLGEILEKSKRELDICARYGGEEFMIILPHTEKNESYKIAERIRSLIMKKFQQDHITVSLGVANCPSSAKTIESLVKKADNALYESKKMGKNRVT